MGKILDIQVANKMLRLGKIICFFRGHKQGTRLPLDPSALDQRDRWYCRRCGTNWLIGKRPKRIMRFGGKN